MGVGIEAALADTSALQPYGGRDVIRTKIAVKGAGDGLSEAMAVEPVEYEIGQKVYLVLECTVAGHKHKPDKDDQTVLELVQEFQAGAAAVAEEDLVIELLQTQKDRLEQAREAARGIVRLPYDEDGEPDYDGPEIGSGLYDDDEVDSNVVEMSGR